MRILISAQCYRHILSTLLSFSEPGLLTNRVTDRPPIHLEDQSYKFQVCR